MALEETIKVLEKEDVFGDLEKLSKNEQLVGASSSFDYELCYCDEDESSGASATENASHGLEGMSVELPKLDIPHKDKIISTLKEFVGGNASCIWMSRTLPWDLNLPMTTPFPRVPGLLQLFVLCAGQPPLLLALCDEEEDVTDVKMFTKDTSSLLHWSLLDFCVLDFAILPCTMTHKEFSLASFAKTIREKLSIMTRFFTSPLHLDAEMFSTLKSATRAQTGATFIPCFLHNPKTDKVWVFLMHKRWRNIVSLLTEQIHKEQRLNLYSSDTNGQSNLNVVLLEVAKRMSFSEDCEFKAKDDTTRQCINRLKEHFFDKFDVTLLMNDGRESSYYTFCINEQDGSSETDVGQEASDNEEPHTQTEADVENSRFFGRVHRDEAIVQTNEIISPVTPSRRRSKASSLRSARSYLSDQEHHHPPQKTQGGAWCAAYNCSHPCLKGSRICRFSKKMNKS